VLFRGGVQHPFLGSNGSNMVLLFGLYCIPTRKRS
jgi:hypothetical protein